MRGFLWALLLVFIASHCKSEKNNDRGNGNPSGFINSANEKEFLEKADEFSNDINNSQRVSLGMYQVTRFAGLADTVPVPTMNGQVNCDQLNDILGGSFSMNALSLTSSGLNLYVGQDCGSAVGTIKNVYTQIIQGIGDQVNTLQSLNVEDSAICGVNVKKLPANAASEAVSYEISSDEQNEALTILLRGAANDDEVGLFTNLSFNYSGEPANSFGNLQANSGSMSFKGYYNTIGNLKEHSLHALTGGDMNVNFGSQGSMQANYASDVKAEGLLPNEKIKIIESQRIGRIVNYQGQNSSVNLITNLVVEEFEDNRLKVSGKNVVGGAIPQEFVIWLDRSPAGECSVSGITDEEPDSPFFPAEPGDESVPIEPEPDLFGTAQLEGNWRSECARGFSTYQSLHSKNEMNVLAGENIRRRWIGFGADSSCSDSNDATLTVEQIGTYNLGAAATGYDFARVVDFKFLNVVVTLHKAAVVQEFNTATQCDKSDWQLNTPVEFFVNDPCLLDLPHTVLTKYSLGNEQEFSSMVLKDNVLSVSRAWGMGEGSSETTRLNPSFDDIKFSKE